MKTIRKSLSRLSSSKKSKDADGIIHYKGVSVRALKEIRDDLLKQGPRTKSVVLFVSTEETVADGVQFREGDTVMRLTDGTFKKPRCKQLVRISADQLSECFVKKEKRQWTTEDIAEFVVLPASLPTTCFYTDLLDRKDVGRPYQGSFVSQARRCAFVGLVNTIAENADDDHFVWLDIFSANQPLLTDMDESLPKDEMKRRYDCLTYGLHDAIDKFDNRFIYFDSWYSPVPLKRTWCVWELYGCARSKKQLQIIFARAEHDDFVDVLLKDPDEITKKLCDIKTEKSECFNTQDKNMIFTAIESLEGGFVTVNAMILTQIRDWLAETAMTTVDLFRRTENTKLSLILHQAGYLYEKQGKYEEMHFNCTKNVA